MPSYSKWWSARSIWSSFCPLTVEMVGGRPVSTMFVHMSMPLKESTRPAG
ncbi:MAG TPA: hypothetical protein VMU72_08840 [Gaiellaceae bacterium]|nr:hypothetical protein [Gaiellaceae bacterium]